MTNQPARAPYPIDPTDLGWPHADLPYPEDRDAGFLVLGHDLALTWGYIRDAQYPDVVRFDAINGEQEHLAAIAVAPCGPAGSLPGEVMAELLKATAAHARRTFLDRL